MTYWITGAFIRYDDAGQNVVNYTPSLVCARISPASCVLKGVEKFDLVWWRQIDHLKRFNYAYVTDLRNVSQNQSSTGRFRRSETLRRGVKKHIDGFLKWYGDKSGIFSMELKTLATYQTI